MAKLDADDRNALDDRQFAFPAQRKEPLENASHVRSAIARFDQVTDVTDAERDAAWRRITAAAKKFGVEVGEIEAARYLAMPQLKLVRTAGIEPARSCDRGILSPLRLPVPPRGPAPARPSRR